MTILLVDAGNTRVKWAIAQADSFNLNDRWLKFGNFNHEDALESSLKHLPQEENSVKKVICSSVIGQERTAQLKSKFLSLYPTAIWHEICGNSALSLVGTKYIAPEKLGADRRAMILGAAGLFPHRNILIISTGTATTIDLLTARNEHLGGLILPGMTLMSQSLHAGTAKLPDVFLRDTPIHPLGLGVDTQSSIYNGILASQLGAIELGKQLAHQQKIRIDMLLVDGGNAELLINAYQGSEQILFSSNLVLKGLLAWHHQGYI